MIHTIDLRFLGVPGAIAAFCIPSDDGAILVECGPMTVTDTLVENLEEIGLQASDIKAVLLTHIHFDHAGAAWWWAEQGATIYVHPVGRPHMIAPERLYESARRIYGDQMEYLWGAMEPIAESKIVEVTDRERLIIDGIEFVAHHTPGHANHHIAWQMGEYIFTGDVGGVKIEDGPVVPPCPPPDIDLAAWMLSIERLESLRPRRLYLTHYGPVEPVGNHLRELRKKIWQYADWVRPYAEKEAKPAEITEDFVAFVENDFAAAGLSEVEIAPYRAANPPEMSLTGLLRYWYKHGLAG